MTESATTYCSLNGTTMMHRVWGTKNLQSDQNDSSLCVCVQFKACDVNEVHICHLRVVSSVKLKTLTFMDSDYGCSAYISAESVSSLPVSPAEVSRPWPSPHGLPLGWAPPAGTQSSAEPSHSVCELTWSTSGWSFPPPGTTTQCSSLPILPDTLFFTGVLTYDCWLVVWSFLTFDR